MSKKAKPNSRTKTIATKVTPAMYDALEAQVKIEGTTLSALLHDTLLPLVPEPETITMDDL